MNVVTLQIGNSDDKLTQNLWHHFVGETSTAINTLALRVHFFGGPNNWEPWQNAAWVFEIGDNAPALKRRLQEIREAYRQDSVAWTEGETLFV